MLYVRTAFACSWLSSKAAGAASKDVKRLECLARVRSGMTAAHGCEDCSKDTPQKKFAPGTSEEIGTGKGFSRLSVGAFFVGRLKVPRASSLPAAAAPRPPAPSVAALPRVSGWLNLPDEKPQY